ncbi:hypothetical protein G3I01_13610 [Gramella sp. MT6]|uniref:hypothetical protein n=1 Tax=Gramella sp. MT6 TaxID=2705471 RepID=UPI001C5EC13C|nr:hypothetical protein [Gramella sp. MT6]QYA26492.1 hypothetical protein G3I01_13610 [Gramella sp. MT6]
MFYFKENKSLNGIGRISVNVIDENENIAAEFLTGGNGYFTYLSFKRGHYIGKIDQNQFETLNFKGSVEK